MRFLRRLLLILALVAVLLLIAAQIASSFLLKPLLAREASRLFQVPVYMDQAGANLVAGSFWLKGVRVKNAPGFTEPDFLSARTVALDVSLLSFLSNELVVERILFKDPKFAIEMNSEGQLNASRFLDRMGDGFREFDQEKPKFVGFVTSYKLEKIAVRNGQFDFLDVSRPDRSWSVEAVSFSLARLIYPPDPEEALPAAIYVNATIPGFPEGKILILGRLNPFGSKTSFDITASVKNLAFKQLSPFFPDFPLNFNEGTLQMKVKAVCHEHQLDFHDQVRVEGLRIETRQLLQKTPSLVFGLPQHTVLHFFNRLQPATQPFEFDFRIAGDLDDPQFNLWSEIGGKIHEAIYKRISSEMKLTEEQVKSMIQENAAAPAGESAEAAKPAEAPSPTNGVPSQADESKGTVSP